MAFNSVTDLISITASGAAATAIASKATAGAALKWIFKRVSFSLSAGATPSVALLFVVRDGLTTAGTIIWQATLACIANGFSSVDFQELHLPQPTAGGPICVETTAAGAATTVAMVNAELYSL